MSKDREDKLQDLATYGVSFSKGGQRIDPRDVYISTEPEQTEQEPVAWMYDWEDIPEGDGDSPLLKNFVTNDINMTRVAPANNVRPLYLAPPKREPLSDKEITKNTPKLIHIGERLAFHAGVRFAEKHHGIGGEE